VTTTLHGNRGQGKRQSKAVEFSLEIQQQALLAFLVDLSCVLKNPGQVEVLREVINAVVDARRKSRSEINQAD
jgi:hypothetical protein